MSTNCLAGIIDASDQLRMHERRFTNQKMRRADALRIQNVQNDIAERGQWAVIKSQHNFMVVERKRLIVLHASDATELLRADRENTTGADSIGIARTFRAKNHVDCGDKHSGDDRKVD